MKYNLEYYRHEVNSDDHWKFKMLRVLFKDAFGIDGWAGEGRFWALNNRIAKSENCHLDYSDEIKKLSDAADLGFSPEQYDIFLEILTKKCKLVKIARDGTYFTDHTQMVFSSVQEDREKARTRKQGNRQNPAPPELSTPQFAQNNDMSQEGSPGNAKSSAGHSQNTPVTDIESKVKESKVKESNTSLTPVGVANNGLIGITSTKKLPAGVTRVGGQRPARKKQPRKKSDTDPEAKLFNEMKNDWMVWFKGRPGNVTPKFDGASAGALSKLRTYFLQLAKESNAEDIYLAASKRFKRILDNWEKLKPDKFLYKCVDIKKINSQINDIINFLNNGGEREGLINRSSSNGQKPLSTSDSKIAALKNWGLSTNRGDGKSKTDT